MKRTLSLLLAVLMTLTAFGAVSVFSGVIGAGAEFLDYFNYVQIPGFTAYSKEGLLNQNNTTVDFLDFTTDYLPEGNVVDKVATFTVVGHDTWGGIEIHSFNKRSEFDSFSGNWSANDLIDGKDIFGDTDLNFEGASGIMFWISANGANIQSNVSLSVSRVPCQGPYYSVSEDNGTQDMIDHPVGFLYGAKGRAPDADGYVYFDFKTDFSQSDWWSRDDDGNNQYEQGQTPIPKSKLPLISGLKITVGGLQIGDTVSIGDMRICYDTRIHTDALDEQISHFDSLDPEAYTEESYLAASEAYFKAYEVFLDPINQDQVDEVETALRVAIANLKPLFHAPNKDIMLEGFESWTEDDLDTMAGLGLDTPIIDEEVVPENKESSVMIMANAVNGEPTWGWSWFTSGSEEGAVGNPFALKEGSAPLSEAAGIRFWVKWDESLEPIPTSMRVGVGSSASGAYFECEDYYITLPETEGYVGIPWTNLYDLNGEYDIYDYIDELDYISILIEGAVGIYYIADLHAFNWDVSSADFAELDKAISEAYAYMDSLTENEWHPVTWDNVYAAIVAAENLIGKYGVTQDEVDEAQKSINDCINAMIPIGDAPTRENSNKLNALFAAGRSYWRGNVTPASYRELMITIDAIEPLIQKGITNDQAIEYIAQLENAINALVPIKGGEKVTSIYSFESYNNRELNRANGDRTEGVVYSLAQAGAVPNMPEGYSQALKMVATTDLYASNTDEHGVMQFKAMSRDTGKVVPLKIGANNENILMGDLTGTDGICLWIGVNDVNLVQDCSFRFAVSNCTVGPLFERAAHDIPLPSTGHGWLYIPWEYFEFYDDWTAGEPINLAKIYFYILRFNGSVKQGLEVYATGIHAYKNTADGEWDTPIIENISEGQNIDISTESLIPKWNAGTATLDGVNFIYGNAVVTNGEHVLEVRNGNKTASVRFTTTGATVYEKPVVSGVEEGGKYTEATIIWSIGTAVLNGEAVESGVAVTEPGRYTLVVTNGTEVVTIEFTIVDKPTYKKGDFDGDEELTVADALAALRIAARMAESSDEAIAIGDIDADGEITVADALAILRVAAKMSDSL